MGPLTTTIAVVLPAVVALWLVSLATRDASIMDVAWGPLFVAAALAGTFTGDGDPGRRLLVLALLAAWALRLAWHIGRRNKTEDARYAAWREQHGGNWWWRSLLQVFLLQGALVTLVVQPVQWVMLRPAPAAMTPIDWIATALFATGFAIEAIADRQLRRHTSDPDKRGTLLTTGLWSRSRHPNYFGEALLWWGLAAFALNTPQGYLTLMAPVLMTYLLRYVSGVPMTEARMAQKPGWDDYAAATPAFVPRLAAPKRP